MISSEQVDDRVEPRSAADKVRPLPGELTAHRRSLKALTGVRFLAALYVVIFHTRLSATLGEHGRGTAERFFANGYLAVPLFFLLSGFILAYTYAGQVSEAGDWRRFWEARFSRIWPVYAVSLALMSLAAGAVPHWYVALATVAMVQAWNPFDPSAAGAWNMVCWTLSCEALFYVCFPFVQVILDRRKGLSAALIGAALLVCVGFNCGARTLGSSPVGPWHIIPLPLVHLPEFLAGVGLGNLFLQRSQVPGRGLWTYGWVLASIGLLCIPTGRWTSLVVVAFCGVIFGLASEQTSVSRILSTRAAVLGGGLSYAMYLMQLPVKLWSISVAERLRMASTWERMALALAMLLAISWLAFHCVEEPVRRWLRGRFAALEARRMALRRV